MNSWLITFITGAILLVMLIIMASAFNAFLKAEDEQLGKALAARCTRIWGQSIYQSKYENGSCYVKSDLGWLPEREFLRFKDVSNRR